MNTIIQKLKTDHQRFLRLIRHMEWTMLRCRHGEGIDLEMLEEFVTYCSEHANKYHHPLEDYIFSLMLARDPTLADPIARMKEEHEQLDHATGRLRAMIMALDGQSYVPRVQFLDALAEYLDLYDRHMQIEENELFSRMESLLQAEDWQKVEAWMSQRSASSFQDPLSHHYRRIEALLAQ